MDNEFNDYNYHRYSRQMMLDGFGTEGQKKLKDATVFIAGAGGLGSAVSMYLAVAGVGTIRICDKDSVEISNLNRQILHHDKVVGMKKACSAEKCLKQLNPTISVLAITDTIDKQTVARLVGNSTIIIDCLDNLPTRFILNEYAVRKKIPFISGGIYGFGGYVSIFHVPETPCLYCVFQDTTLKDVFPVIGVTPGIIGTLQAMEAIKYLTGIGDTLKNNILTFDGMKTDFKKVKIAKNFACPVCSSS